MFFDFRSQTSKHSPAGSNAIAQMGGSSGATTHKPSNKLDIIDHLGRLSRFGANIVDAHACIILLPEACLAALKPLTAAKQVVNPNSKRLKLSAFHSLSDVIDSAASVPVGEGLIGWVGQHGKPIHLSPFDKDSRDLGIYRSDCGLMSFIAVPFMVNGYGWGVLTCDSLKPGAFTVLHSHLLHDFASEVSAVVELHLSATASEPENPWNNFKKDSQDLINALGAKTIALMRLTPANYQETERAIGMSNTIDMAEQLFRLFQQSLPPHFPMVRLPNGEVVIMLDRMMTSFYESKLTAVTRHVQFKGHSLQYRISSQSLPSSTTRHDGVNMATKAELNPGSGVVESNPQMQRKSVGW